MAVRNRRPQGGRIGLVLEMEGVAVINRSLNKDVHVNDPEPPHQLAVFEAGNIDPRTEKRNCVQFYTRTSAMSFQAVAGDALEFLSIADGKTLLLRARELGSFQKAYEQLRGAGLIDLSTSPDQVRARAGVVKALKQAGMRDHDIPQGAGIAELRRLHQDFLAGRHHLKLMTLDGPQNADQEAIGGRIKPLDLSQPGLAAEEISERQLLRGRLDEMGVPWHPAAKAPKLRELIAEAEAKRAAEGAPAADGVPADKLGEVLGKQTDVA